MSALGRHKGQPADCHPRLNSGYSEDDTLFKLSTLVPSHVEVQLLCSATVLEQRR